MDVKIIDRTREEKNKSYEIACADSLDITVEELRKVVQEILDLKKESKKFEESGMVVSIGHTTMAGKVMLSCDTQRLLDIFGL